MQVTGFEPKFVEASTTRLRPDQWRLFGGAIAIPILLLIFLGELLGWSPIVIGLIGAYGVMVGGLQMFHEAFASLLSKQMGFQVLTSIGSYWRINIRNVGRGTYGRNSSVYGWPSGD